MCQGQCGEKDPDTLQESTRKCGKQRSVLVAHELGKVGMGPFGWSIMGPANGILLSPEHRGEPLKGCESRQGCKTLGCPYLGLSGSKVVGKGA